MRLTNTIRQAFVNAAMNDVPKVDYEAQATKLAKEALDASFPVSVQKLIKDPVAEAYINREYHRMPMRFSNFNHYAMRSGNETIKNEMPKVWAKIEALHSQNEVQLGRMKDLRLKLEACANAATTRKQLVEMLPEFEKYLPEDEAKANRQLPVVANVVSDFVKAGWPKQNAGKIAAAKAAA
jgi:hypothetical protein